MTDVVFWLFAALYLRGAYDAFRGHRQMKRELDMFEWEVKTL